jgi:hypothetical protein
MSRALVYPAVLVVVIACGGRPRALDHSTPPPPTPTVPTSAEPSARSIDWLNRTYGAGEDGEMTLENGVFEFAYDEEGNQVAADYQPKDPEVYLPRGSFSVTPPIFGDLDHDNAEEAVLITLFDGGGTGKFSGIDVYSVRGGEPVLLGSIPGGDRGDGGIADLTVENGVIHVERYHSLDEDGTCCPSKVQDERWTWNGTEFVEDEAARVVRDNQ